MKVEAKVSRTINEAGNQKLTIEGEVLSDTQQGVLPAGKVYDAEPGYFEVRGGSLFFSFSVEARDGEEAVPEPKLPSQLTPHEQSQLDLQQKLNNPDLDEVSKSNILQKLDVQPVEDVVSTETPADAAV